MGISLFRKLAGGAQPRWLRLGLLAGLACSVIGVCVAADSRQDATLPLKERIQIATQARSDVEQYFAHWQGIGNLDFDAEYANYQDEITRTDDRRTFDLVTMKLGFSIFL